MIAGVRALEDVLPREAFGPMDGGAVAWSLGGAAPEAVVSPGSVEETAAALAAASRAGLGVVPAGRMTSPGPEAPDRAFVVLSTRRLAGVEDYEPADLTATARAGTLLGELAEATGPNGQWLPSDPPHAPRRTVGGLAATGARGPLAGMYGAPRDHVLGLTVVTGDGRVLRLGGRVMKNVAGFDLVRLLVGSRGTLGVVTSASVRLFPRPAADHVHVVSGEHPGELLAVARAVATAKVVPASAVLVSGGPAAPETASLVVRVHGAAEAVAADARTLLGEALDAARLASPSEAGVLLDAVRDQAADHPVVLRAFALPGLLPEVLAAVQDAVPVAALAADVLSGRVRVGVSDVGPEDADALLRLRARLEALGGTLSLERCPPEMAKRVRVHGGAGRSGELSAALRAHFDPAGILSSGRYAP